MEAHQHHRAIQAAPGAPAAWAALRAQLGDHGPELAARGWQLPAASAASWWISIGHAGARRPDQGWKLHVSAGMADAEPVLARALVVLLREDAEFKLVATPALLQALNAGAAGISQIGKFITVYPNDDQQAVRLAAALHAATCGLRGPAVPSDRPLAPGSLVHYRYGGFQERYLQVPSGAVLPAMLAPDGRLVPDARQDRYAQPGWVDDPFQAAGLAERAPSLPALLAGRYLVLETIHRSAAGAVARALDTRALRPCVIKRAARYACEQPDGRDARDLLRHEAQVLERLAPDPRFPQVFDLFTHGDDLLLVQEDCGRETLADRVASLTAQGRSVANAQLVAWARQLASLLMAVNAHGLVHRDLKPHNVVIGAGGALRLIDFDLCYALDAQHAPVGEATPGYSDPAAPGDRPDAAVDVYSLGALLYGLATGADPSYAPQPAALLSRPIRLLRPDVDPAVAQIAERCLAPSAARRPALDSLLAPLAGAVDTTAPEPGSPDPEALLRRCRRLSRRFGAALADVARDGQVRPGAAGPPLRDLRDGIAGVVYALAAYVAAGDAAPERAALTMGVEHVRTMPTLASPPLWGLYVGEAGVGMALLRAGQALSDPALIAEAAARGRLVAASPFSTPDMMGGAAGRARFHLRLWEATGEPEHLGHAIQAGDAILRAAVADHGLCWPTPPGDGEPAGPAPCGYAYGAAGIGDVLLELHLASGAARFRAAAQGAAQWLARHALPALDDDSGQCWPDIPGSPAAGAGWQAGAAGIGRFLLRASCANVLPEATLALGAVRMAASGDRGAGPTYGDGLAGRIELLLDAAEALGDPAYASDAWDLARLLLTWVDEQADPITCWMGKAPLSAGLLDGYGGITLCLLRLSGAAARSGL